MHGEQNLTERAATLLPELIEQINVPVYKVEEKGGYLVLYLYGHAKPMRRKLAPSPSREPAPSPSREPAPSPSRGRPAPARARKGGRSEKSSA